MNLQTTQWLSVTTTKFLHGYLIPVPMLQPPTTDPIAVICHAFCSFLRLSCPFWTRHCPGPASSSFPKAPWWWTLSISPLGSAYLHTIHPLDILTPSFFAVLRASPHSRPCRRRVIHHRLYASRPLIPFSDLPLQPYLALGPSLSSRLVRGHGSLNPADLFLNKNKKDNTACSLIFS
ncbi:hypothetical protein QWA68_007944 [Fusarium oxysporum]|nr:hypothetical protein QWA68_007944 [Fusarium oxysporum]